MRVSKCPICNSKKISFERKLEDYKLVKCNNCKIVFVNPRPEQKEIEDAYDNKNELSSKIHSLKIQSNNSDFEIEKSKIPDILRRIDLIKKFNCKKVLDFGCGKMEFARLAKNLNVISCDVGNWPESIAKKNKLNFKTGTLQKIKFKKESFDAVHSNQVFEHLFDPFENIKEIYKILKPNGIVLINVPNYNALSIKLGIDKFKDNTPPGHLFYYTSKSIVNMMKKAGFKKIIIISEYLGNSFLRKISFYDKSNFMKKIVKKTLNRFGMGNELIAIGIK